MELTPKSINIGDQTTKSIGLFLKKDLAIVTLSENAVIDSNIITLTEGHSATSGELIFIQEGINMYQGLITNVEGNDITLDTPLDYAFTTSALIKRCSIALNVNGSVVPVIFDILPNPANSWDITQFILTITDNVEMDDAKFGGITALTKGIYLRKKIAYPSLRYENIGNVKSNNGFVLNGFERNYSTKAPSGYYGVSFRKKYAGQTEVGVAIRLQGKKQESLQLVIQDDLSALYSFNAKVHGHVLD